LIAPPKSDISRYYNRLHRHAKLATRSMLLQPLKKWMFYDGDREALIE
jgi:hypothetical protein